MSERRQRHAGKEEAKLSDHRYIHGCKREFIRAEGEFIKTKPCPGEIMRLLTSCRGACFTLSIPSIVAVKRDIYVDAKCSDCVTVISKLDT